MYIFLHLTTNIHLYGSSWLVWIRSSLPGLQQASIISIAGGTTSWEDVEMNPDYEPVPFVNPVTGEMITVYSRPENNVRYRLLTNPEGLYRRYDGLEVYLNRRFLNQLALSASFVYSKTRGNVPNSQEIFTPATAKF